MHDPRVVSPDVLGIPHRQCLAGTPHGDVNKSSVVEVCITIFVRVARKVGMGMMPIRISKSGQMQSYNLSRLSELGRRNAALEAQYHGVCWQHCFVTVRRALCMIFFSDHGIWTLAVIVCFLIKVGAASSQHAAWMLFL